MKRLRFFVLYPVLLILVVLLVLALIYGQSTKCEPSPSWDEGTLYYRGFGFSEDDSFWGKRYYKIIVSEYEQGYWVTYFRSVGINRYEGFYANGRLKEEGEIFVIRNGFPPKPFPDRHEVWNGKYYKPDGTLGATVSEGTGTQKLWYPNGQVWWELELVNGERVRVKQYSEEGKMTANAVYIDGKEVYLPKE